MKKSNTRSFLHGVLSGYFHTFLMVIIGIWLTPFSLSYLSNEEYAVFILAADMIMWITAIDIGVNSVVRSKIAKAIGAGKNGLAENLVNSALSIQLIIAAVILIIGVLISFHFSVIFQVSESLVNNTTYVLIVLVVSTAINVVNQIFISVLVANKKAHFDSYIKILMLFIKTLCIVFMLMHGYGIISLAIGNLLVSIISSIVTIILLQKMPFRPVINIQRPTKKKFFYFFNTGIWFTIGGFAGLLILNVDRLVIAKFITVEMVTYLSITMKLYLLGNKLISGFVNIARPYFSQFLGGKEYTKLYFSYKAIFLMTLLIAIFYSSLVLVFNEYFVKMWVGEEYYLGLEVSFWLCINFILQSLVLPNRSLVASTLYNVRYTSIVRILEGVVNIILSLIFVKYYGIIGVIIASVISTILFSNIALNIVAKRIFENYKIDFNYSWKLASSLFLIIPISIFFISQNDVLGIYSQLTILLVTGVLSIFIIIGFMMTLKERSFVKGVISNKLFDKLK